MESNSSNIVFMSSNAGRMLSCIQPCYLRYTDIYRVVIITILKWSLSIILPEPSKRLSSASYFKYCIRSGAQWTIPWLSILLHALAIFSLFSSRLIDYIQEFIKTTQSDYSPTEMTTLSRLQKWREKMTTQGNYSPTEMTTLFGLRRKARRNDYL